MDPIIGGALIGGASSILGGLLGGSSARSAAASNARAQKEFAQYGIRWKVADAKAAGIHPLAALGAQTHSFSPSYVGDNSMGAALASAGQDIGRAVSATATEQERRSAEADAFINGAEARLDAAKMRKLDLQNRELQNALLASDLARKNANPNPPFPTVGATPSYVPGGPRHVAGPGLVVRGGSSPAVGAIDIEPGRVTSRSPSDTSAEAGTRPAWVEVEVSPGVTTSVPSNVVAEGLEGQGLYGHIKGLLMGVDRDARQLGNAISDRYRNSRNPPNLPTLPGHRWAFNPLSGTWVQVRRTFNPGNWR